LAAKLGSASVNLLRPKPPVSTSGWLEESSLAPEQNLELHKMLTDKNIGEGVTLDQSLSFLSQHRDPKELYYNGVWGCGAGRRFLTIGPDGNILACSHLRKSIGKDGEFMYAWKNSSLLEDFRLLEDKIKGKCRGCKFAPVCRRCRAVVCELGGDFFDADPHCPTNSHTTNVPD
jgi:radical SAM protein with 4Fe4S-binding SPASM domain